MAQQAANLSPDQSQKLIYSTLVDQGIPDPLAKIVTAQSGHETNGWTSHVFLTLNNAFGYGFDGSSYKQYSSVEDSVSDIVAYIQRRVRDGSFPSLDQITDPNQYAELLKNAAPGEYYQDTESNYAAGIARWFNDNLTTGVVLSAGLILAIAVGVWIIFFTKK